MTMGESRIPHFNNIEEEAAFWDTHSTEDYADEMEQADDVRFVRRHPMTTRETLAALSDAELDERVALDLMGWTKEEMPHPTRSDVITWYRHPGQMQRVSAAVIPAYSKSIGRAWQVVQRITRIPQSKTEAEVAPNTRFGYAWEHCALWSYSEAEAARWICEQALLAWESGPLFPEGE